MKDDVSGDLMDELEKLDAFLEGSEPGHRPIDLLAAGGIEMPDEATLDDAALHEHLWIVIQAMAGMGMFLDSTDHLSDRELYRWLALEGLLEEAFLPAGGNGAWCTSPIAGCSEEDIDVYLRYYATDEDRTGMQEATGVPLPPRAIAPWDRDRLLPRFGMEHADA